MVEKYLHVKLADDFELKFRLLQTPITELWLDRMHNRAQYPLDHPNRFYGFDSRQQEIDRATDYIQHCIAVINSHTDIINRPFTCVDDQDCLNYFHNIFERYHGLLDQQDHAFWTKSPVEVRQALAELNLAVHRCETASRGSRPRFVCTWFGMPKTKSLSPDLIGKWGTTNPAFGTVCLNYVEIGKTLEDLTLDQDAYIATEAFKPFHHYSADFAVRLFDETDAVVAERITTMHNYYNTHIDFFHSQGYNTFDDARLLPYRLPVAQLETDLSRDHLLKQIQQRQHITQVYIQ